MNFGRGFSIPQENGIQRISIPQENGIQKKDYWFPVTPAKPIPPPRSTSFPVEIQGNQLERAKWQELAEIYGEVLQGSTNFNGAVHSYNPIGQSVGLSTWDATINSNHIAREKNRCFNSNGGSFVQNDRAVGNGNYMAEMSVMKNAASVVSANGIPREWIHNASSRSIPKLYSQVDSNWTDSHSVHSLFASQNGNLVPNQRINGDISQQMCYYGCPIPYRPDFNLNSPPQAEADAASTVSASFQYAPITPEQRKQLENDRISEPLNFLVRENSNLGKDERDKLIASIRNEASGNCRHDEQLLQNIVDSSAAISRQLAEKKNYDEGIELNKTPQQKPPKRRKHRPKVVVEGKPKRTPKPTPPKNRTSNENPTGKRKYVRKKGLNPSETLQADVVNENTVPDVKSASKSCRRELNFDLENETIDENRGRTSHQVEVHQEGRNLNYHATELGTRVNSMSTNSAVQIDQHNGYITENEQARSICNFTHSTTQIPTQYPSLSEWPVPTARPIVTKDRTLNVIARNINMRNANPCQNSSKNGYNQVHQDIPEGGKGQNNFEANTGRNLNRARTLMLQSTTELLLKDKANFDEQRGSKREYSHSTQQIHPRTVNLMDSLLLCQEMSPARDYNSQVSHYGTVGSETQKKKKIENIFLPTISSMPSGIAAVKDCPQVERRGTNVVHSSNSRSQIDGPTGNWYFHSIAPQQNMQNQYASSELHLRTMAEKMPEQSTATHDLNSLNAIFHWNLLSSTPPQKVRTSDHVQGIETCHINMSTKKQIADPASKQAPTKDKMLLQEHKDVQAYKKSYMKARGSLEKEKYEVTVDEITYRLRGLNIHLGSNKVAGQEQSALVPYKGDGTLVQYEGFDPIKKRKPRPKVDLDPETNRIWNFLMGKEGSENTEATDIDKEKWWEEERKVFRGRVDSFIARMHLVQGDRRFSQWKGSVVDSVIGVFLTQNVSDHLSSSAFMSLAAKFPLQSTTISRTGYQNGTTVVVEEPEVQILDPDGTILYQGKIESQPGYNKSSVTRYETSEHRTHTLTSSSRGTSLANEHNMRAEEDFNVLKNSFGSFIFQAADEIRSSSGSNSEAEDQIGCQLNKNCSPALNNFLQRENTAAFQECYSHLLGSSLVDEKHMCWHQQSGHLAFKTHNLIMEKENDLIASSPFGYPINSKVLQMQESNVSSNNFWTSMMMESSVQETEGFKESGEDGIFSLLSTSSGNMKAKGAGNFSDRMVHMAEIKSRQSAQQNKISRIQALPAGPSASLNTHPEYQGSLKSRPHAGNYQQSINDQQERLNNFQSEHTSIREPIRHAEELAQRKSYTVQQLSVDQRISAESGHKFLDNKEMGENAKEKIYSLDEPINEEATNVSNTRKRKAEDEKRKAFDWDTLRQQVQSSCRRKERSKDAMDSLDYEAIRLADVNEISNAIRGRGMNNMLADRIKDFLNRLVKEHESIDLEWLRDVAPDKAKDYLLSIRGLGLKSVECVRLLTLHNLAFPVDTNVGRIAVRLGWVPLQPLPESLQLHLLEMYPVLESIQKYLWPRLCKLDQRTLYELHYQMITFGKVFCTKSKPNCNACPMRAECRHFASAFASARLALPGPEERSIVSSVVPIASNENPAVLLKPMPLPPAEINLIKEARFFDDKCEPIVEVPTTPESSIEISQSDIEDAFYEDPEEIPAINLNLEEFTLNLQNYMQENMELQEGDMSKALVALNPEAASIPTPKLKNVSRLRTEHQVYELPDSHPLLIRMDRREPDDPSPYLLAIWTPGETANSIQAPEKRCESQELGNLCQEKTCFSCNSIREANSQTVRGTILIPCRTAMRGSFPLNGTYFQVNEMFADHESSLNPIDVPRAWIWNLPRRTVYFGTSVTTIFKGLSTEGIQYCFWRGFVCVRGFDQKTRAPRPLMARLHFHASMLAKAKK